MHRFLRCGRMRALIATLSLLPLTGCCGVPCVYVLPKVHYFPATQVGAPAGEVRAVLARASCRSSTPILLRQTDNKLVPLEVSETGRTDRCADVTIESRMACVSVLSCGCETRHERQVRLYRPGYRLVTLHPWPAWGNKVEWIPAETPEEQEAGLDGLLADLCPSLAPFEDRQTPAGNPSKDEQTSELESSMSWKVAVGRHSGRDLLLFAADEYARIADQLERQSLPVTPAAFPPQTASGSADSRKKVSQLRLKSEAMRRASGRIMMMWRS